MKSRMLDGSLKAAISWEALMHKAIARAKIVGDPRLKPLETAMAQGKAMQALKRFGIIGEADIEREFPKK